MTQQRPPATHHGGLSQANGRRLRPYCRRLTVTNMYIRSMRSYQCSFAGIGAAGKAGEPGLCGGAPPPFRPRLWAVMASPKGVSSLRRRWIFAMHPGDAAASEERPGIGRRRHRRRREATPGSPTTCPTSVQQVDHQANLPSYSVHKKVGKKIARKPPRDRPIFEEVSGVFFAEIFFLAIFSAQKIESAKNRLRNLLTERA